MKRIWKCPNCTHFSTRHWNLKLHIERKHKIGQPVQAYVSGKSTFKFTASAPTREAYIIQDKNEDLRNMWRDDKWFDRISRLYEMKIRSNKQSNMNQVQYFPQPARASYGPVIGDPDYTTTTNIEIQDNASYDNVIGFKMRICEICLATTTLLIVPNMEGRNIQDIHKCDPKFLDVAIRLDQEKYYFDFTAKVGNIPELLFKKCKDWAKNTTGDLYLVARQVESKDEYEKVQIPENYKEIPWLKKLLVESKIKPDDNQLHEFLRIVKNETTKFFTLKGKDALDNLVYKIGVSTVPILLE